MEGGIIMSDLVKFEGLIYSRDELKGELQKKKRKTKRICKCY